jgi:murein DD-endopeptidase MepM/ murein hydrolase activator NlpD
MKMYWVFITLVLHTQYDLQLPIRTSGHSVNEIHLTAIGQFGLMRKPRPTVPAHFHTGIDIERPGKNYTDEPIFPITGGTVISKRDDGAYAQLIIEHEVNNTKFWTVYEHIAGIKVKAGQRVAPTESIARFMNKAELDKYGWQFDHFHFEVLKIAPVKLKHDPAKPERNFASHSLTCFTKQDLDRCFYHPLEFLKSKFKN